MHVRSELMVQVKQKGVYGVQNPLTRHFLGGYRPAPMNHVKYLRAGPTEMPFQNLYTAHTNHFHLADSVMWKSKNQLG